MLELGKYGCSQATGSLPSVQTEAYSGASTSREARTSHGLPKSRRSRSPRWQAGTRALQLPESVEEAVVPGLGAARAGTRSLAEARGSVRAVELVSRRIGTMRQVFGQWSS